MEPPREVDEEVVADRLLTVLHGLGGMLLGALVWSGAAAVFDAWSLPAAPGVGWLVAWSCARGARRPDPFARSAAWVLGALGAVLALLAYCAFTASQASPGTGLPPATVLAELLRLLSAPPWFGSAAVLLALAGVPRGLPRQSPRPAAAPAAAPAPVPAFREDRESRAA